MTECYEEIVRNWYEKLRPEFATLLMNRYHGTNMRPEDVENIYQDTFVAVYDNLKRGKVEENSSWRSYIMRIGLNLASKQYRLIGITDSVNEDDSDDETCTGAVARNVEIILNELSNEDESLYRNPKAHKILSNELALIPEKQASLIRFRYFSGLKDAEILEEMPQYSSVASVKVTRNRAMKELSGRVKRSLLLAGLITEGPSKAKEPETSKFRTDIFSHTPLIRAYA